VEQQVGAHGAILHLSVQLLQQLAHAVDLQYLFSTLKAFYDFSENNMRKVFFLQLGCRF